LSWAQARQDRPVDRGSVGSGINRSCAILAIRQIAARPAIARAQPCPSRCRDAPDNGPPRASLRMRSIPLRRLQSRRNLPRSDWRSRATTGSIRSADQCPGPQSGASSSGRLDNIARLRWRPWRTALTRHHPTSDLPQRCKKRLFGIAALRRG